MPLCPSAYLSHTLRPQAGHGLLELLGMVKDVTERVEAVSTKCEARDREALDFEVCVVCWAGLVTRLRVGPVVAWGPC